MDRIKDEETHLLGSDPIEFLMFRSISVNYI